MHNYFMPLSRRHGSRLFTDLSEHDLDELLVAEAAVSVLVRGVDDLLHLLGAQGVPCNSRWRLTALSLELPHKDLLSWRRPLLSSTVLKAARRL